MFEVVGEGSAPDFFELGSNDGVVRLKKSLKEDAQRLTVYTVHTYSQYTFCTVLLTLYLTVWPVHVHVHASVLLLFLDSFESARLASSRSTSRQLQHSSQSLFRATNTSLASNAESFESKTSQRNRKLGRALFNWRLPTLTKFERTCAKSHTNM